LRYAVKVGRKRLHDQTTTLALLDAAERIVDAHGLSALTVRGVADEVGTSTRAVYSTLGSKQGLAGELGARAFDMLGARVHALPTTDDPAADLVTAGCSGFRWFATEHPALFRVGVQRIGVPDEARQMIGAAAGRALVPLTHRIHRLQVAGGLGDRSVSDATWAFHALCEGLAAVELRCKFAPDDGERIWQDALTSLVVGWRHPGS
jgi:AcrR family transcriptional regulator